MRLQLLWTVPTENIGRGILLTTCSPESLREVKGLLSLLEQAQQELPAAADGQAAAQQTQ